MKYLKLYSNDDSYMADKPNLGKLWVASTKSEKHVYYSSEINNSLCFTAIEDNASVKMVLYDRGKTPAGWQDKNFYYKKNDDVEWTEWVFENNTTSLITLNKGEKLYVMSDSSNSCCVFDKGEYNYKYYYFTINKGKISASGNIMSLLNFTPVLPNYAFYSLFEDCTSLVSAPELPATTLSEGCYKSMFTYCSSLTTAPELPATTLATNCYNSMFNICRSLTQAPALPATTLASHCYEQMFSDCSSLTQAPELPATTLVYSCYQSMFSSCSSLTQAPELPADTLAASCYSEMFRGCTSLTQAPELPATTLANYCYKSMFSGCSSLTQAPELPATTLADYCYNSMFYRCSSLTQAPALPATTLVNKCYQSMFSGCSKLNYIKALFTTKPNGTYTYNWVSDVSKTGEFVMSKAATWDLNGVYGMPNGIPDGWDVTSV